MTGTQLTETLAVDADGWRLIETGFEKERAVVVASNFLVGNGYLGYRGTSPEQTAEDYVALVVTDTYDCADGHWRELTTAPNPLYVAARIDGQRLSIDGADDVESSLDLRSGEFGTKFSNLVGDATATITVERFASYDQLHLLTQRWTLLVDRSVVVEVDCGVDGDVWSLNGVHLPQLDLGVDSGVISAAGHTSESNIEVACAAATTICGARPTDVEVVASERGLLHRYQITLSAGDELVVDSVAAVMSSNDVSSPQEEARLMARTGAGRGYDQLRTASQAKWSDIWCDMDVKIEGAPVDQAALRFSAYHNRICTPSHSDRLPIGARGLSCQAYQGSAFWDQEIYNLPAFLFTEPAIARSLLVYRHRTLDGARRKAARLGYDGAFYAWVSGVTGDELCPDVFFEDVLTGRPIRNHFNVWQMHVAPDIVTMVARYVEVSGDLDFLAEHGAEIAFEVARFLRSFVRYNDWLGTYHTIRLLGPDEWHENVDDNAFTNYQSHAALTFAIQTYEWLSSYSAEVFEALVRQLSLTPDEVESWRRVRDGLVLPQPDSHTGLIEQFEGFFDLEDVLPEEVRGRLIDPGEYWGWPNGVAVATQVSKQADIVMLLWLHGDRFDDQTIGSNYDYYEPRCAHGSSLSHAAHGMVSARLGRLDQAVEHFRETATVDLLNTNHSVVGGTFIGGIHTAACGGTYQLAVQGFGGLSYHSGQLNIDPVLPPEWESLTYPVHWRGQRLKVSIRAAQVQIEAAVSNPHPTTVMVRGTSMEVNPGATVRIDA